MRRLILCLLILFCTLPLSGQAQTYVANPQYRQMVRQLFTYVPDEYNFGVFRRIYTQTEHYDPIGDQAVSELLSYAYKVDTAEGSAAREKALVDYNAHLSKHLANPVFVRQAYVLAKQDERFGNPEMLLKIYQGLLRVVMMSGDGTSLSRAYDVITLSEETFILGQLGHRIKSTDYHELGIKKYNMHFVENPGPDDPITIFINVRVPMQTLEEQGRLKKSAPADLNFKGGG